LFVDLTIVRDALLIKFIYDLFQKTLNIKIVCHTYYCSQNF